VLLEWMLSRIDMTGTGGYLQTMEDFADCLQTAERNTDPPVALTKPVLVAVIDDVVDINDASV
jgi:hypothetical protein